MTPRCPRCDSERVESFTVLVEGSEEKYESTHRCANPLKPNCQCRVEPFRYTPAPPAKESSC